MLPKEERWAGYIVPADAFEAMLEKLDDLEIKKTVEKRRGEKFINSTPSTHHLILRHGEFVLTRI
jgi:hypothetical protein